MRWRDGQLRETGGACEPIITGWGAFTTAGCDEGRPLLWDRHQSRLQASADYLGAGAGVAVPDEAEISAFLSAAGIDGPARLRVVVRRVGDGHWSVEASADEYAMVGPVSPPARLAVDRWGAAPPLAGHKTLSRLPWDLARQRAVAAGADDVVLTDIDGNILESSVANVWVVREGVVRTPPAPARCLPGIMRGWLLENLPALGIRAEQCDLDVSELDRVEEVWISNAVIGVRRVGRVLEKRWDSWPLFERVAAAGVPAPGWPKSV